MRVVVAAAIFACAAQVAWADELGYASLAVCRAEEQTFSAGQGTGKPELEVEVSEHAVKVAWGVEFGEPGWKPSWQVILWRDAVDYKEGRTEAQLWWEVGLAVRPERVGVGGYLSGQVEVGEKLRLFGELGAELSGKIGGKARVRGVFNVGLAWEL